LILRNLHQFNGDFISIYTFDPETEHKSRHKIECKGTTPHALSILSKLICQGCILTHGMGHVALDQVVLSQVAGTGELWDLILDKLQLDEIDELNWGDSFQRQGILGSFQMSGGATWKAMLHSSNISWRR